MLVICSAPQKRFIANGRSRLTVKALILSPSAASCSLNFLVCTWHTGVSSEGTTLMKVGLPRQLDGPSAANPVLLKLYNLQSGACWPLVTALPARVMGV